MTMRRSSAHDDQCELAARCGARLLACQAFWHYARLLRWETASREPSHRTWRTIFRPNQRSPEQIARMRERDRATKAARGTNPGRRMIEEAAA